MSEAINMLLDEIESLKAQIQLMSFDAVTGLPNRGALDMELEARQSRQMRGEKFAVLFLDIDHFKAVNDTHGHAHGDYVLAHVASAVKAALRPHDHVGRYGGEEFIVITEAEGAEKVAERIRAQVACLTEVTVSIGVCFWLDGGISLKSVLQRADTALYEAKRCGRNRVQYANDYYSRPADRHGE